MTPTSIQIAHQIKQQMKPQATEERRLFVVVSVYALAVLMVILIWMEIAMHKAERFNKTYKPGETVIYINDFGDESQQVISGRAWAIPTGDVLVGFKGKSGGYDVTRIKPLNDQK